ncbi:YbaL family putative K(+) efflux transporter [Sinorhizobium meliloti]|uniref:YbaL family putative K(+) efflux transporter n=1 Tax=Rhizobium meliloti TaxID=382 RepID=UPI000FD6F280|nr:YbaL family putative K(+) efflux transporter [Sinorhizobium meliloti]RVO60386.1 Kef family K(+) transporter [Sinorhizobium meliloti]
MPHTPLIATLVAGLGLAFILGTLANRLRLSPLVGYLLAGVLIGPFTPGFVADQALARQLAELGVILLMFGIGLHFSLHDLLSVRTIAVPGAFGQMALVTSLGFIVTQAIGWPIGAGLVFGLALSVASTVVVLRALQEKRQLETDGGRIAVGWLVVEDVAMILALVLLPAFADVLGGTANRAEPENSGMLTFFEPHTISGALGLTLAKLAAFFALMAIVGRRVIPAILHYVAHTGSRELFRLAVLAIALGVAFGAAELFGVSFALGAFFAGMILAESQLSQRAAQETLPLRDAFAVLFFVSVGMLFNPMILVEQPLLVAATFLIIVIGNAAAASAIAVMFGYSLPIAVTLGLSLAQIGEFSFILAGLGVELNLLPETGRDLVLAGAILSILINPLLFADRLMPRLENRAPVRTEEEGRIDITPKLTTTSLTDHAILVGYGRVGRLVAETLQNAGQPYLIVEERQVVADQLRAGGVDVISGNAAQPGLLEAANVNSAKWLISAIPNPFESGNFIEHARATNPKLEIIARAHSDAEVEYLKRLGANLIIMGEKEIARSISEHNLSNINAPDTTTPSDSESRLTSE